MSDNNSPSIELAPIRSILQTYCYALSERGVALEDLTQLVEKNIGWSQAEIATSDGTTIFLPAVIERFGTELENFEFLKVMLTQQAGHIEFGSFDFEFGRPSSLFYDLRADLQRVMDEREHNRHDGHHHETAGVTQLTKFFRLFPNKQLALSIFSIIESARVEASVMRAYPGIAVVYRGMRERVLALRQDIRFLPTREAFLESLIRVSLGERGPIAVPKLAAESAVESGQMLRLLLNREATVEDSAEATIRIYGRLAPLKNAYLDEHGFTTILISEEDSDSQSRLHRSKADEEELIRGITAPLAANDRDYLAPQGVDYRGDFQPELAQLLRRGQASGGAPHAATAEELAKLLRNQRLPRRSGGDERDQDQDRETDQMVQNLIRELARRDPRMQNVQKKPWLQADDEAGPLSVTQPNTFVYDEWDVFVGGYRRSWCKVHEKTMGLGDLGLYQDTLLQHSDLLQRIRREFEQVAPEMHHKEKRLPEGTDHDLDLAVEALTDLRVGVTPSEKIFWRHHKNQRDVAVAFLLDMSGSTGETIAGDAAAAQRSGGRDRSQRRIIDVEREAIVLMADALETVGDRYAVYGFSGHGRDNVEFYVMKEFEEEFSLDVARRLAKAGPLHATRMGPAVRHTSSKLRQQQSRSRFLFLISDGRPQDRGYSQESSEKAYAVQDTRMAFVEARRDGIAPFCLTVDKEGNDYLRVMIDEFAYEVLSDINLLPQRLPQLYRKLTF
jgi:nitric oxide reductase NorD protein